MTPAPAEGACHEGDGPASDALAAAPPSLDLRAYQHDAIARMRGAARRGHRAILLVLPTGGGKTVVATAIILSHLAKRVEGQPRPHVLFVAHRTELIAQAARTIRNAGVARVRTIDAGRAKGDDYPDVTVASVQTLTSAKWRDHLPAGITLLVFDETHHVKAATWMTLAKAYEGVTRVGLTATPERADGSPLGDVFTVIVVVASTRELIELGYLVPCDVYAPSEAGKALAEDPVQAYQQWGGDRRAVVFVPTVAYARALAEQYTQAGIPSAAVDGTMSAEARGDALARFRAGETRVMVNAQVLTEGWDDPGVEVCILTRNPDHSGTYLQMVGRVLRISPATGKTRATLIDLRGAYHKHGLPDEDRDYSLDGEAIKVSQKAEPCKQCPACGYVASPWQGPCPRCAFDPPLEIKQVDVDGRGLALVNGRTAQESKAAYERRLRAYYLEGVTIAKARGYKLGWAWHRYKQRYPDGPNFRRPKTPIAVGETDGPEDPREVWRCTRCRAAYDDVTRGRWMHATKASECEQCMLDAWIDEGAAQ